MELSKFLRPNILALRPYVCAREEYEGAAAVMLDANESPYANGCNRYPDPRQRELRGRLAAMRGVAPENIVLGNGSDEIIDLLVRSACRPGMDNIAVFVPGYAMYEVCAAVNDTEVRRVGLTSGFMPDLTALSAAADARTKLVFLCSPNNPTGNVVPLPTVARVCRMMADSLVVVDEAYIDFSDAPSAVSMLGELPNLFVLQTLSKSWGMAGLRIGAGIGRADLVAVLDRVRAPYNIGAVSQREALRLLDDTGGFRRRVAEIRRERERLLAGLRALGIFSRVYPSQANFILATTDRCRDVYGFLARGGVVVRMRDIPPLIPGGIRISIGMPAENDRLLELLNQWKNMKKCELRVGTFNS